MSGTESIRYRSSQVTGGAPTPHLADDGLIDDGWHPVAMAISCFLAAILVVSWLFEPGRGLWDQLDLSLFRRLNRTLDWGSVWQGIWAVANWRPFDAVVGLVVFAILMLAVHHRFPRRPVHAFASVLILVVASLVTKELVSEIMVDRVFEYQRGSPTLVLGDTLRLSSLVPWVECKDISRWSFPGDHGFVLLMCAIYVTYFAKKRVAIAAWGVAVLGVLPRLIGGAHWPTDIIVGSGAMALVTSALVFATPVHDRFVSLFPSGEGLFGDRVFRQSRRKVTDKADENQPRTAPPEPRTASPKRRPSAAPAPASARQQRSKRKSNANASRPVRRPAQKKQPSAQQPVATAQTAAPAPRQRTSPPPPNAVRPAADHLVADQVAIEQVVIDQVVHNQAAVDRMPEPSQQDRRTDLG